MCKQKCEQCKCKKSAIDYDKYIMTTSPHHIRNRVDTESETLTCEDENLHLISFGVTGVPEGEEE